MAGLKSIPDELYDAAAIDGARFFSRLWYITIPLMRPVIGAVGLEAETPKPLI